MTVAAQTAGPAIAAAAETVLDVPRQRLGSGQIVTSVLAIFFRRLPKILLLSLPGALVIFAVFYVLFIELDLGSRGGVRYVGETLNSPFLAFVLAIGLGLGLLCGSMASALQSYELRDTLPVLHSFRAGAAKLHVALVQGLVIATAVLAPMMTLVVVSNARLGIFVGGCALVVGMYALGRWGLGMPCIAIEGTGMRGMRRSAALSADYRWAIAGTCFLLFVAAVLFGSLTGAGFVLIAALINWLLQEISDIHVIQMIGSDLSEALVMLDLSYGLAIIVAIMALGLAAIRARLVEIKEPLDIETVLHVFD